MRKISIPLITSYELSYLKGLLKDFPGIKNFSAEEAIKEIRTRYGVLEDTIPAVIDNITNVPILKDSKGEVIDLFPTYFKIYSRLFHEFLYNGILSNAGEYRRQSDPNQGYIGFGGLSKRILGNLQFAGSLPKDIQQKLEEAYNFLKQNVHDPIENAFRFYQLFVHIHPYYDANGRVGRLIVTIYLQYHKRYIFWEELEGNGNAKKFLKKINNCHKREGSEKFNEYFEYFLNFVKPFVIHIDELDEK